MDAVLKGMSLAVGAYTALTWRCIIGVPLSAAYCRARGGMRLPARDVLRLHVVRGTVSAAVALAFFWGLARVPMAHAVALTFIAPIMALFLARALLGEHVGRGAVAGSALGFSGVIVIVAGQDTAVLGEEARLGAVAILFSACAYAYNLILMRRQSQVAEPAEVAFFQNLTMAVCFAVPGVVFAGPLTIALAIPASGAALLALASSMMLSWAYGRAEAGYLAPVEYTAFVWASLLGWCVFGETIGLLTLAGAALIIAGCAVASRRKPDLVHVESVA
jgi:S-adenosylmethionine uptake transporter